MAPPCSEQPLALWSHSPLSSRHKGTQVSVLIPSAVTHQEPSWVPGVVLGVRITEGRLGFPSGSLQSTWGGTHTHRLPWSWCHLEGCSDGWCGPRKGTAYAILGRGIDPNCTSGGERWGNQENLTWNTAEDWLPLRARAEQTQGSRPGFLSSESVFLQSPLPSKLHVLGNLCRPHIAKEEMAFMSGLEKHQ